LQAHLLEVVQTSLSRQVSPVIKDTLTATLSTRQRRTGKLAEMFDMQDYIASGYCSRVRPHQDSADASYSSAIRFEHIEANDTQAAAGLRCKPTACGYARAGSCGKIGRLFIITCMNRSRSSISRSAARDPKPRCQRL
jgi:hypothetical protein